MNRQSIANLDDLLEYSVGVINKNLAKERNSVNLLQLDLKYNDLISNTHYKDIPIGYPGWYGRVWVFFTKRPDRFASDALKDSLIHPGSGGYGTYDIEKYLFKLDLLTYFNHQIKYKDRFIYPVSYDCSVFLDDLPGYKLGMLLHDNKEPEQTYINKYERDN